MYLETKSAEAALAREPNLEAHRRINAAAVCELCGGVSLMTLHRWLNRDDISFPRPVKIAGVRYWRAAEILAWLDAQAVEASE